jgi:hypothetical protein
MQLPYGPEDAKRILNRSLRDFNVTDGVPYRLVCAIRFRYTNKNIEVPGTGIVITSFSETATKYDVVTATKESVDALAKTIELHGMVMYNVKFHYYPEKTERGNSS